MGEFFLKNFGQEKDLEVYSKMSETKAAFAVRAIQSFKHNIYDNIESHGGKFVPKVQLFVSTLNYRKSRSIEVSLRVVKKCDFLSVLYNKLFMKYTKLKFKIRDRNKFQKMIFRSEKDTSQSLQMKFFNFSQYLQKKP